MLVVRSPEANAPSATLRFITIILAAVASRPPARGAVPAGDRPADSVLCCDAAMIGIETQLLPRTFMPMRPFASQSLLISVRIGSLQCSSKLQIRNRPRFLALPSRLSANAPGVAKYPYPPSQSPTERVSVKLHKTETAPQIDGEAKDKASVLISDWGWRILSERRRNGLLLPDNTTIRILRLRAGRVRRRTAMIKDTRIMGTITTMAMATLDTEASRRIPRDRSRDHSAVVTVDRHTNLDMTVEAIRTEDDLRQAGQEAGR
ncbi:hypothetical protein DTO021D3_4609 [Paecilomyces variotii]|nr:hypothetical protein DTO032I3_4407 [Paecilomyces variotii]KAJ9278411.1 hypothetical protein DTO021D3_4609 [Paecilomyces variotii]KAJ9339757.1 hypothetical protein DTO027B6_7667 [Paecilomyces variotii]KAJ9377894.1 hypothetical protein DTO032I4_7882 [Paecilomyces variotii]